VKKRSNGFSAEPIFGRKFTQEDALCLNKNCATHEGSKVTPRHIKSQHRERRERLRNRELHGRREGKRGVHLTVRIRCLTQAVFRNWFQNHSDKGTGGKGTGHASR